MKTWFDKNTSTAKKNNYCVGVDEINNIAVLVKQDQQRWEIVNTLMLSGTLQEMSDSIASWVGHHRIQFAPCYITLPFEDVSIYLTEMPNVPAVEQKKALKWKLTEYIDYPSEQAAWDYIELPLCRDSEQRWCYLVVSPKHKIDRWQNVIEDCDLLLTGVDAGISCLRTLMQYTNEPQKGQALIWLSAHKNIITIMKDKQLYMMRELEVDMTKSSTQWREDLVLEIQRSIDYCTTKYQNISVVKYQLLSQLPIEDSCKAWLQKELACELEHYDKAILPFENISEEIFHKSIFAIGCIMAHEHETKN